MTSRLRTSLAAAGTAALLLTGCGAASPEPDGPSEADVRGHVHGLGVDPADDTLYVASHFGLFRVGDGGKATRVADRWQDTMAFTVTGPGRFLASGHPDPREDLPPHLGLIESTDGGETWTPLALQGEADFHVLEQVGDVLYAYDATSGRLLRTSDASDFEEVAEMPLVDLAPDPDDDSRLLATTPEAGLVAIDAESGAVTEEPGPAVVMIETTLTGELVGVDAGGAVHVLDDTGEWREVGTLDGTPEAFAVEGTGWYAATRTGVFTSSDTGRSWSRVL